MIIFYRLFHFLMGYWPFERGRDFFMRHFLPGGFGDFLAESGPWIKTREGCSIQANMGRDEASLMLKMYGELEPATKRFLLSHAPQEGVFLDVGANVGYFSLLLALEKPSCRVVALEPNPKIAALLQASIQRNELPQRVNLRQVAASEQAGRLRFGVDEQNSGHSRLANEHHVGGFEVDVVVLDEWLPPLLDGRRLELVKIDVEGAELQVLRGMRSLLATHRPTLVVEGYEEHLREFGDNMEGLRELMSKAGYVEARPWDGNLYYTPT